MAELDEALRDDSVLTTDHFKLHWLLSGISPILEKQATLCAWPPDVFALTATAMEATGCYVAHLRRLSGTTRRSLADAVILAASEWRDRLRRSDHSVPTRLQEQWDVVRRHGGLPLREVNRSSELQHALHFLMAAADEASDGLGYKRPGDPDIFEAYAQLRLSPDAESGSTLCSPHVSPTVARVLPKMHTPQRGLSLRSLSRNLALFPGTAIRPFWFSVESPLALSSLNLLIVPWPETLTPSHFRAAGRDPSTPGCRDDGYFTLAIPGEAKDYAKKIRNLLDRAKDVVERVDGLVFPELALRPDAYDAVQREAAHEGCFLVAGVGQPAARESVENLLKCDYPYRHGGGRVNWSRGKHHRWKLDRAQILQYGLGGALHTQVDWWEKIPLVDRCMGFFALAPRFVMCSLVCEDLAQQDPLGYLMRSVGPNLVVALLMDGPQISQRWSSRYASVLADDPGSSVLTLTSLGMSRLCRPPGLLPRNVVALWKDASCGSPVEIELPHDSDAAILHISVETGHERTADGRSGEASYPVLGGVHFVKRQP